MQAEEDEVTQESPEERPHERKEATPSQSEKSFVDRFNEEGDDIEEIISLTPEQREVRRLSKRPDISHLVDAVTFLADGTPVFVPDPGERVVVERFASCLSGMPWLETKVYTVREVNESTGALKLWDDELHRCAHGNYITAREQGIHVYKLPCPGKDPFGRQQRKKRER